MATPELASAILASAQRLGISPKDLATVISYETAGTFDPWKAGPTTQWGQHRGLIQWGEPQRAKYGVSEGMPVSGQLGAVERYLTDAGVKPGMGLLDVYSAVNAGRVGRYNASDANNGGAPGTVADKVNNQMAGHAVKADRLLGLVDPSAQPPPPIAPSMDAPRAADGAVMASAPAASPSQPMGLLGALASAQEETPEQSAAFQQQVQGLLAQAIGGGEQQQESQEPGGLLSQRMLRPQLKTIASPRRRFAA